MQTFKEFLSEAKSLAPQEAKSLGLTYMGFGRYGAKGIATHQSLNGHLVPISKESIKKQQDIAARPLKTDDDWDKQINDLSAEQDKFKTRDFKVPEENMPELKKKIEFLSKKAVRLGAAPITLVDHGSYNEVIKNGNPRATTPADRHDQYGVFHVVTVEGEAPKLNGWSFVAKLEPLDKNVLVHVVPGQKVPKKYSALDHISCEHCNKSVRRNETFVVVKGKKSMQVGRSCLKDFLGHNSPENVANWAETLSDLEGTIKEYEEDRGGGRVDYTFNTKTVLALSFAAIRRQGGFKPSSFDDSTRGRLSDHFFAKPDKYRKEEDIRLTLTPEDEQKADAAITWMKAEHANDKDEFWNNLHKMTSGEIIKSKHFGYVAALAGQYEKAQGFVVAKKALTDGIISEPLGDVGERVKFSAEVLSARTYNRQSYSYYDSGVSTIYMMKTPDGKLVKWFGAGQAQFKQGDKITGKGTIKSTELESYETSPFKGKMVTVIGRGTFDLGDADTVAAAPKVKLDSIVTFKTLVGGKEVRGFVDTFNKTTKSGTVYNVLDGHTYFFNVAENKDLQVLGSYKKEADVEKHIKPYQKQ